MADAPPPTRRFPTKIYLLLLGLVVLCALAPIISVLISSAIASSYGCALDEGSAHPCVIGGSDWGEALNTMFVLGWFGLLTLPAGALAFVAWLIVLIIHRLMWRKRTGQATGP